MQTSQELPILTLGAGFYDEVQAARFPEQQLLFRNQEAAAQVGLDTLTAEAWQNHFAHFMPLPGNLPSPLALRYHGHQFDSYNPHLGDGRGFLFAQLRDTQGRWLDLGTKGSGTTPYSRGGDGRLTLRGGLREILATEMLEALGVPTSRSFSLFETGESLFRADEPSPARSSVLVRLSHGHIRIGSFQRHFAEGSPERLQKLLDYSVTHLLPELKNHANLPFAFVQEVGKRLARLCASWHVAGFVHGVLNSDNMNITGESFDYGPYRFLPHYDLTHVAAYFDYGGLYAFGRQARAVYVNLQRLAQSVSPLDPSAPWDRAFDSFVEQFQREKARLLLARLGLTEDSHDTDQVFCEAVFDYLGSTPVSYDGFFFDWWGGPASRTRAESGPRSAHYEHTSFAPLRELLLARTPVDPDRLSLPYFQKDEPVSLVHERIQEVLERFDRQQDRSLFESSLEHIQQAKTALGLSVNSTQD